MCTAPFAGGRAIRFGVGRELCWPILVRLAAVPMGARPMRGMRSARSAAAAKQQQQGINQAEQLALLAKGRLHGPLLRLPLP